LTDGFEVEVFAQAVPVFQQKAYRHLVQIERVVTLGGIEMQKAIRALKCNGVKTEPSVAQILRLPGDPYQSILDLERLTELELKKLVSVSL
jgi:hypothetical protein